MPSRDRRILSLARSIRDAANAGAASGQLDGEYVVGIASDADDLVELLERKPAPRHAKPSAAMPATTPARSRSTRRPAK